MDQAIGRPPLVLDEPVPVAVPVPVDPGESGLNVRPDGPGERLVGGPLIVGSCQQDKQWGGVDAAVVPAERHLPEHCHLAIACLMQNLARLGILRGDHLAGLSGCQVSEHPAGQVRPEPEALQGGDDPVAAEWGVEPWHPTPSAL
jgi:hypothetical protein